MARLLHRLDGAAGLAEWVDTTPDKLRAQAFLDGRTPFWTDKHRHTIPFDTASGGLARFLFHVGFCGSTLLARLLDAPGRTLVLREPQALVDLTDQRGLYAGGQTALSFPDAAAQVIASYVRCAGGEIPVVKPSNWVNAALPELADAGVIGQAVFLTMDRRAFLRSVFRGGRDRLAFCARLAAVLSAAHEGAGSTLHDAVTGTADPLDQMARLAALAHLPQERAFTELVAVNGWSPDRILHHRDLVAQPDAVAQRARQLLDLPMVGDDAAGRATLHRHAKDPGRPFDAAAQERADSEVEHHHGARFDRAAAWLAEHGN